MITENYFASHFFEITKFFLEDVGSINPFYMWTAPIWHRSHDGSAFILGNSQDKKSRISMS
jgi:hypothetical protein